MFAVQMWEWYHSSQLLVNKETDKHILENNVEESLDCYSSNLVLYSKLAGRLYIRTLLL